MLFVDRLDQLDPLEGGTLRFLYAPLHRLDGAFTIAVEEGLALGSVRVTLDDEATVLAASVARESPTMCSIALGDIEQNVILQVGVRPVLPITRDSAAIHIEAPNDAATQLVRFYGDAAFHARSTVRLRSPSIPAGGTIVLDAEAVNDGTIAADDVVLCLQIPRFLRFAHPLGAIEHREGERWFVIPLGGVNAGGRIATSVELTCDAVVVDGTAVPIAFRIVERRQAWGTAQHRGTHELVARSTSRGTLRVRLVREGPYRHGETVFAVVSVAAKGTDALRDVVAQLEDGAGVQWSAHELTLGNIHPHCSVARLVDGIVTAEPRDREDVRVSCRATAVDGTIAATSLKLLVEGQSRIEASMQQNPHGQVALTIENVGDGLARDLTVALDVPGADAVLEDSLVVDRRPVYAPDRAAPFARPVQLGTVGVGIRRTLSWCMTTQENVAVVIHEDGREPLRVTATAQAGEEAASLAIPVPVGVPVPVPTPEAPELVTAATATDAQSSVRTLDDVGASDASHQASETALRWSDGSEAVEQWRAWFENGPDAATDLARYVLAARAFLPVAASSAAADAALAGIRSEADAIVGARLESWREAQTVGASGFDFGTPRLRSSVRSFYLGIGQEEPDVEGVGLDRALVLTIGAEGVLADAVVLFRDAVLAEIEARGAVDEEPAPRVLDAAVQLDARLREPAHAS